MKTEKNKIRLFILLIAGALAAEIFLCNISFWKSLFYRDRVLFETVEVEGAAETGDKDKDKEYITDDGIVTLRITGVNQEVHNLFLVLSDFSEQALYPYSVSLTDEGNSYPYTLPESYIVPGEAKTWYTNIYSAGKVSDISVQLTLPKGSRLQINGLAVNARIPFVWEPVRFLIILFTIFLFYGLLGTGKRHESVCAEKGEKPWRRQLLITLGIMIILMGMAWKLAHINPICISSPWPHHKQYQELAYAIADGHLDLDIEPSKELQAVENPYDTINLQANGIDYKADYAFRNGRYYVYFGIVPELLFYLPYHLMTGKDFPNYVAVFSLYCGFIAAVFCLYRELIRRWFPRTSFFLYILLCSLTVCGGNYLFVIARPDLYDTPIMAATMFTAAGLWLWIRGKFTDKKSKAFYFAAGSLCMALVAGCRPQMLLFSALAIPLFYHEVIKERKLLSRKSVLDSAAFCLPYIIVAAGLMFYNAARFGSVFDFGATYSLTSNDMTNRGFNLSQLLLGIWHFFIQPPIISSDYPFLQGNQIASASYMGKLNSEYTYGGILICNAFLWILLYLGRAKTALKEKGIYAFTVLNIVIALIIGAVDVTGAGILQRYTVDMVWGVWLAAVILMMFLADKLKGTAAYGRLMGLLAVICVFQALYGFGVIFGNGDLSVNVRTSNWLAYYKGWNLLRF